MAYISGFWAVLGLFNCKTEILQERLGESLIKKFKQLELYEITTLVLAPSNVATALDTSVVMPIDTNVASSLQFNSATSMILDFANVITANDYRALELIEEAQNFTV